MNRVLPLLPLLIFVEHRWARVAGDLDLRVLQEAQSIQVEPLPFAVVPASKIPEKTNIYTVVVLEPTLHGEQLLPVD